MRVASLDEVPLGEGRVVQAGSRTLAVFNVAGRLYALDNACMHRGGPLGEGDLDGCVVTCPWHAWRWDVTTGANVNNPSVKMTCVPVIVTEREVFVEVPEP